MADKEMDMDLDDRKTGIWPPLRGKQCIFSRKLSARIPGRGGWTQEMASWPPGDWLEDGFIPLLLGNFRLPKTE